jgi:hypothetical protein
MICVAHRGVSGHGGRAAGEHMRDRGHGVRPSAVRLVFLGHECAPLPPPSMSFSSTYCLDERFFSPGSRSGGGFSTLVLGRKPVFWPA